MEERVTENTLTKVIDAPYEFGHPHTRLTKKELERLQLRQEQAMKEENAYGKKIDPS